MASRTTKNVSAAELRRRWDNQIRWMGEEANYMTGHQVRYGLIEKWLARSGSRLWINRHVQAYGWITELWMTEGLMSVRRQLDGQYGSLSLTQLLREIESRPDVLAAVSAPEVAADRNALEQSCGGALEFAHRQLAHRTPWDDPFVSGGELDVALNSIAQIVDKYHRAITGQQLEPSEPEPDPNWLRSFEVAWHKPRKRRRTTSGRVPPRSQR